MIAVALSPKARALIRANRDWHRPTAADRERITAALRARLGEAVLPLDPPPPSPRLMSAGIQRGVASAFGVCVVGSALLLTLKPEPSAVKPPAQLSRSAQAAPTAVTPSLQSPESAAVESSVPALPTKASPAPGNGKSKLAPARTAQDTLPQELALLTSAASQLSSGQAGGALVALEEHQRRFARGILSDERNVAKARALCMLHRFDEGRAVLALLASGTPSAARVKEECDATFSRAATAHASHKGEAE